MPDRPPIYVGYLGLPARHRRFVGVAAAVFVVLLALGGGVMATSQREPGDAVWDLAREQIWLGVVRAEPYPMLVGEDGRTYLLVGTGKFGVHELVAAFDGRVCRVQGFALTRDNRCMIELRPGETAIEAVAGSAAPRSENVKIDSRDVDIAGEIVDGKCYLGAMKPGDGKAHKACAVLCIRGGLPPLIAADVPGSGRLYPLIRVDGSAALTEDVLAMVGEPVRIRGRLSWVHGFPVVDVSRGGITRYGRDGTGASGPDD